jgi:chromosome partitioning protein
LLTKDILAAVDSQFSAGQYVFQSVIKRSVRFGESVVAGQSILAYDPKNPGAQAYREVADEIVNRAGFAAGDGIE